MKKIILLFVSIISVFCFVGCQQTPNNAAVILKDQNTMVSKAEGKEKYDLTQIPEQFIGNFTSDDNLINVTANADIHILGTQFPIVRVQPVDFSQDEIDKIVNEFLSDATLYTVDYIYTKSEISILISSLQEKLALYEGSGRTDEYDEKLADLVEAYNEAPETHQPQMSNKQLEKIQAVQGDIVYQYTGMDVGESNLPLQKARYLYVRNNWTPTSIRGADFTYCDNRNGQISDRITLAAEDVTGEDTIRSIAKGELCLSPIEAARKVEELIEKLNLHYSVFDVLLIEDAVIDELGDIPNQPSTYSYKVRCTRDLGSTSSVLFCVPTQITGDTYSASWAYEQFYVYIDDSGIYRIDWTSPYTQDRTLVQESAILDFDSIIKALSTAISYGSLLEDEYENLETVSFSITNVYLGMQRIIEQNSIESGLLIPVWCFFGTEQYEYADGSIETYDSMLQADPIIVINAIDGTIIDPIKGY